MKRMKFNFWDCLVGAVLLIFAFIQSGLVIPLSLVAFLLYMLVRVQFSSATNDTTSICTRGILAPERLRNSWRDGSELKPLELLRRELAEAEAEEVEVFKEVRRWGNRWYEEQWMKAKEKSRCLAAELSRRKNGRRRHHN
jgi:hypothetical protein